MADERQTDQGPAKDAERQGVRESQPEDLNRRREIEPADVARANEPRTDGEPATGRQEEESRRS